MPKYTAGPWEQHGSLVWAPGRAVVAEMSEPHPADGMLRHNPPSSTNLVEVYANAGLVSKAPQLVDELRIAVEYVAAAEGSLRGAMGDNLITPDLQRMRALLSEIDKLE